MKRVFLAIIGGLLLFLFGVSVAFRIAVPKEEARVVDKYFIYIVDEQDYGSNYSLEIDEDRNINLTVHRMSSVPNGKEEQFNYDIQLSKAEYTIVKKAVDYFQKSYKIGSKKEYKFYFDFEAHKSSMYPDDKDIMLNLVKAIEYVSLGNEFNGEETYRELGTRMLESIEKDL